MCTAAFRALLLVALALLAHHPVLAQSSVPRPKAALPHLKNIIGEYVAEDTVLRVFESDGTLRISRNGMNPARLLEAGFRQFIHEDTVAKKRSEISFEGEPGTRPLYLEWKRIRYERRHFDGEDGTTFTIRPLYPFEQLQRMARQAVPPAEEGEFRNSQLVELHSLDSTILYDIRYATTNNFMKQKFYSRARAYLQRPAAQALVRVHRWLAQFGYGLLIHDAYRPWKVTKMFWDATPQEMKDFVADPSRGSRHNRGCAVDVTLCERKTGKPVEMVSGYDEFSERSHPDYAGGTSLQRWHRALLREAFEREGFTVYYAEWWHFDYKTWRGYRIEDRGFEELERAKH